MYVHVCIRVYEKFVYAHNYTTPQKVQLYKHGNNGSMQIPHIQLYFDDKNNYVWRCVGKYISSQLSLDLSIAVGNVAE